jgi:hypothetical protein
MPERDERPKADARVMTEEETETVSAGLSDDPPNPNNDPVDPVPPPPSGSGG